MARFFEMLMAAFLFISVSGAVLTTPTITGAVNGTSGTAYSYSTLVQDEIQYNISWGDGTSSTSDLTNAGTSASLSHTWTVPAGVTKTFAVTSTVNDSVSDPISVTIIGPATVNNPPSKPRIPRGDIVGNTKYSYTYTTMATDPDGDQVEYTFNWGDGTSTTTNYVASGAWAGATHRWIGEPGIGKGFNITAKATDTHGKESAWSAAQPISMVTDPVNHPPTIPSIPSGPVTGLAGVSYTFTTSATDPDGDYIKYIFEWGDGSSETGYFPSGQTVSASHSWSIPRSYRVRARCADSNYMKCSYPYWSDPRFVIITGN